MDRKARLACAALFVSTAACATGGGGPIVTCESDDQCSDGEICRSNRCVRAPGDRQRGDPGPGDGGDGSGGDGEVVPAAPFTITILSPTPYSLVAGITLISAEVVDEVGISFVNATIADAFDVELLLVSGDTYAANFDTTLLGYLLYPSLVISAVSSTGARVETGHVFALDNAPPIVALESPDMCLSRDDPSGAREVSVPFSPLGASAVRHGDVIDPSADWGLLFYPRARIEDRSNRIDVSPSFVPAAGVDPDASLLYILDSTGLDAGHRLLLGSGPGSTCTRVDPAARPDPETPQPDQAIIQRLVPTDPDVCRPIWDPADDKVSVCTQVGFTPDEAADLTCWLPSVLVPPSAAIYVLNDFNPASPVVCTGGAFDARNLSDGPACLVVVAQDGLGNRAFAHPIAICIDKGGIGIPCTAFDADSVQAQCTDGCTSPDFPPPLFGAQCWSRFWVK